MSVITRFAPSPTGFLHIGGARTALFNWLFARHHGGKFLLRIEDTDRARSTQEAIDAILNGMHWLGLDWDDEPMYQSNQHQRHVQVAHELIAAGRAYKCYCSKEELEEMRQKALAEKRNVTYDGRWRERDPSEAPEGVEPVIRLKTPIEGQTIINDQVQGQISVPNADLDDMILLRSDGTPTYMLAVVVDDHDMGITHVIRGDDHLTNASRQALIYKAMDWDIPDFSHIPLIHGSDGAKLSKRHGALGVQAYREMGYLPNALRNYLLRLGWSHGDDEIIRTQQAIEWFDMDHVGKSPSRFDMNKLNFINGHYMRETDEQILLELLMEKHPSLSQEIQSHLIKAMPELKERSQTISELADQAEFLIKPIAKDAMTDKARKALNEEGQEKLKLAIQSLQNVEIWQHDALHQAMQDVCDANGQKLGKLMAPIRAAITGSHASPSMFSMMEILGKKESIQRLEMMCNSDMMQPTANHS